MLAETQPINIQLLTGQERLEDEIRNDRDKVQKLQTEPTAVDGRRSEEAAALPVFAEEEEVASPSP